MAKNSSSGERPVRFPQLVTDVGYPIPDDVRVFTNGAKPPEFAFVQVCNDGIVEPSIDWHFGPVKEDRVVLVLQELDPNFSGTLPFIGQECDVYCPDQIHIKTDPAGLENAARNIAFTIFNMNIDKI